MLNWSDPAAFKAAAARSARVSQGYQVEDLMIQARELVAGAPAAHQGVYLAEAELADLEAEAKAIKRALDERKAEVEADAHNARGADGKKANTSDAAKAIGAAAARTDSAAKSLAASLEDNATRQAAARARLAEAKERQHAHVDQVRLIEAMLACTAARITTWQGLDAAPPQA